MDKTYKSTPVDLIKEAKPKLSKFQFGIELKLGIKIETLEKLIQRMKKVADLFDTRKLSLPETNGHQRGFNGLAFLANHY